ncbi:MAG TPA: hypothetical protein DCZ10_16220 [Pelotomaculum sp.]|uniref:DUF3168 domain-containing protein n=1 Tax=Syntrophomonas wolfei TaxID=863 RepID=A0A354YX65_9FIRM|nr:hypothetical protein [Pelotomaculum sp.]HBK53945.1 hypothetical protein [Syntrophomonas wolfei]
MIDLKPTVYSALKNDPTLTNLVAGRVVFYNLPDKPAFPCITYYEQTNAPALRGDDREMTSESVMVIDVWSKGNTTAISQAVDNVMSGLHFVREFAGDLYENDTGVYHKSMRYRHKTVRR